MTIAPSAKTPLLFVEHVHKRYGGVHALRDVHLDVAPGEIHALVGENGAGKSTIINILAGAVKRDEGRVTFDGRLVDFDSPAESQAAGIAVIHQELATLPTMSVAENVCMGRMPTKGWWLDKDAMNATTRVLLDTVGLDVDPGTFMRDLSLSHQQLAEIAKALGAGARLLVMDEPTASLTDHEALRLHALARQLRDQGTAILFVSHRLSEVFAISDRITVFRDGSHVATVPTAVTTPEQIVGMMVGRAMSLDGVISVPDRDAPVVLEVRGLMRRNPAGPSLEHVNLTVRRGEIVGLAGLVGAGRSELARAIFGEDSFDAGVVLLNGAPTRFRSPADALRAGVAMVPEDRTTLALFPEQPVRANMSMAVLPHLRTRRLISRRAERALANDYVGRLRVNTPDIETPVRALSGGNQQKTVLARWLATKPKLLILDEPTHGVDVGAKAEIHELIRGLARDGIAILLISSELPEILALSARIVVMREGHVAATLAHDEADERLVMLHANRGRDTISRNIYGQFAEHLGRLVYDGVWSRSSPEGPWQMRDDVVQALKRLKVPNIRWPGGCFADTYHWKDGVGAPDQRPSIVNTNWGGVTEDNGIGTHEYLALMKAIGAEPYIVGNIGSGTVQEMHDWWEYVNHPGRSPMADLRRKNGQDAPFNVRFWGMANEAWGCGGNMRPEYYADELRRYGSFLPSYGSTRAYRIAVGPNDADYNWTEVVMREAGRNIEGLDMHHYTLAGPWSSKGPATGFTEAQWFRSMRSALAVDEMITRHSAIMDKYDPRKRVALIVGEWGTWHDPEPGSRPGFLYQQNTMRDALVAAASLDIFNRHADRVRGANIAQMVNVLQAMILTQGNQMLLTPTYHVFEFYTVHHDAVLLPITITRGGWYTVGVDSLPAVSASASRDRSGIIHLTMSNLDPNATRTVTVDLQGASATNVTGRILSGDKMDAHNTFERPDVVKPAPFTGARVANGQLTVTLPARSVIVLELR